MADRDGQPGTTARSAVLPTTASLSAAYDWRARHRMVPGRRGRWARYSIPVVDLALGAVFLAFALESVTFILRYGGYAIYVADFALYSQRPLQVGDDDVGPRQRDPPVRRHRVVRHAPVAGAGIGLGDT